MLNERQYNRIRNRTKIDPVTGCWIWQGHIGGNGYGDVRVGSRCDGSRKSAKAHRAIWQALHGPIPKGLVIMHKCDVRLCCNPDHLAMGTQSENLIDALTKGRRVSPRGEEQGRAKLTDESVREIRTRYKPKVCTFEALAREYGVTPATIARVYHRRGWTHVV